MSPGLRGEIVVADAFTVFCLVLFCKILMTTGRRGEVSASLEQRNKIWDGTGSAPVSYDWGGTHPFDECSGEGSTENHSASPVNAFLSSILCPALLLACTNHLKSQ